MGKKYIKIFKTITRNDKVIKRNGQFFRENIIFRNVLKTRLKKIYHEHLDNIIVTR